MAHPLHHGGEYVVALFVGVCDLGACVWKWRWYGAHQGAVPVTQHVTIDHFPCSPSLLVDVAVGPTPHFVMPMSSKRKVYPAEHPTASPSHAILARATSSAATVRALASPGRP